MANLITKLFQRKGATYYVTTVSPSNRSFSNLFGSTPSLSPATLIDNYQTIPDLFKITNYIADKCASIPAKVVKPSGREAKNSELNKLIARPNQFQSWKEFVKTYFSYFEPLGNAYVYGLKPAGFDMVSSLYLLPADKVQVVLLLDKSLPHWMNEVAAFTVKIGGKDYTLPASEVMHSKYVTLQYDDGSWVYGMSKYIPGDKINRELKAIHDAKTSIIEERGAVGFITNESEMPDPEQTKEVKERLKKNYGILEGQDKIIVTTEKLRWQQMALGVQELQLIENAKYSFNSLCQINGFDPVIFSTEGSTFANKKEAIKDMMIKVIKPKVDEFYSQLNSFIGAGYSGDQIVADWSQVEEMQSDRKEMTELLTKQIASMIITPKEAREILYGEMEGEEEPPDEFFRATNLVPASQPEPQPQPVQPMQPDPENPDDNTDEPNPDDNGN